LKNLPFQKLIKLIDEGSMLSNPAVKHLVQEAIATGDEGQLREYLEAFPEILSVAERNIKLKNYHALQNPFSYPSRKDSSKSLIGPLKFGYINPFHDMFGIDPDELCLPVIVAGRVGAGKSALNKYLLCQILRKDRTFNVVIPDLKLEYRHLLSVTKNLKVIKKDYLKFNPLQVPNWMTPHEYIVFFAKLFVSENYLAGTSQNFLISALEYLYKERGIFEGSKNWPTLHDLYRVVLKRQSSQQTFKYRDILLGIQNRLDPYIFSGKFDRRVGIPLKVWKDENVVLELDEGFIDEMYSFVVSYLVALRYTYNKKMGLTGSKLKTLFMVDEGRILFDAKRDVSIYGESYITEIITKIREFGLGMYVSSQETNSFNKTLRSICYLKICFPLTDGADLRFVEESFGLNREQKEYLFRMPRFGQAIVRYGGYPDPFLLAVPHFRLKRQVSDAKVDEKMARFYAVIAKSAQPASTVIKKESLPAIAASLLYFLSKEPFTKISQMTNASGFKSPAEVKKALKWLEANSYITRQAIRTSKRGRNSVFAVLSDKALNYLGTTNLKGKGSFEHNLYIYLLARKLRQNGCETSIEGKIDQSQKSVDVLAFSQEKRRLAYEITLHLDNLVSNITQDIRSGADSVIIVTRDAKDREKAMRMANSDPAIAQYQDKVSFYTIIDLIG
jgi:hypothetical protein